MACYVMEEMNIPHGDGHKRLFPRLIDSRCISHEALVEYVAKHCGFDVSEGPTALLEIQGRGSHRVYTLRTTNPDENG